MESLSIPFVDFSVLKLKHFYNYAIIELKFLCDAKKPTQKSRFQHITDDPYADLIVLKLLA